MFANAFACFCLEMQTDLAAFWPSIYTLTLALSQNLLCQVSGAERFSKCESTVYLKEVCWNFGSKTFDYIADTL